MGFLNGIGIFRKMEMPGTNLDRQNSNKKWWLPVTAIIP
jgi:hypothetical protein